MPWKPPSVNDKKSPYNERWRRIRLSKLQSEPLCRMCLSAGMTVPATVVDHIKPIEDGGTHEESNLQPLCKRCHDAIKTPSDVAARDRASAVELKIIAAAFGASVGGAGVIDARSIRRMFASGCSFPMAHTLSLAAMTGIVTAAQRGDLPKMKGLIVTDDIEWARFAAALLKAELVVQPLNDLYLHWLSDIKEIEWLRERYGIERDRRLPPSNGTQPSDV